MANQVTILYHISFRNSCRNAPVMAGVKVSLKVVRPPVQCSFAVGTLALALYLVVSMLVALEVSFCSEANGRGLPTALRVVAGVIFLMASLMLTIITQFRYQPLVHGHSEDQGKKGFEIEC